MPNSVAEQAVEVKNASGLHIRPAGMVSKTAISFRSKIAIIRGTDVVNARSIVALTTLGVGIGTRLTIRAEGPDADDAVRAIVALFEGKFGEE
jgi:phosphocarrier protein HPr